MKRTIGLFIFFSATTLFAQDSGMAARLKAEKQQTLVDEAAQGKKTVTRALTLKYPNRVNTSVLDGIGLVIKRSGDVVVITGALETVDTAEAILKQLDSPPPPPADSGRDIQLTAYMIIASPSTVQGTPVPKDLDSAISQVSSIFPYKSFNLFDAIVMRMAPDSAGSPARRGSLSGALPQGQQTFASGGSYNLSVNSIEMTPATPANLLRLNNFDLALRILSGFDKDGKEKYQTVTLDTNIDMKEGQKIVVGKANIDGSENALIVIVTAKVTE